MSGVLAVVIWAIVSNEVAYRFNIFAHWDSIDAAKLAWAHNRILNVAALLAVLKLSIDDQDTGWFVWLPLGASAVFIFPVSDEIWKLIDQYGSENKFNYFSYQWMYSMAVFFPPVLYFIYKPKQSGA